MEVKSLAESKVKEVVDKKSTLSDDSEPSKPVDFTYGFRFWGLPPLFVAGGIKAGVSFYERVDLVLEVGGGGHIAGGPYGATSLRIAPIPGEIGKRFSVHGTYYRTLFFRPVNGQAEFELYDYGVGYRGPMEKGHRAKHWFIELSGLHLFNCEELFDECKRSNKPIPTIGAGMMF
jgi:hypothetical protein